MPSITITLEHPKGNDPSAADDGDLCQDEIEVVLGYEPADPYYGADRDGNRSISVPGSYYLDKQISDSCPECNHVYSPDEEKQIFALAEAVAKEQYLDSLCPDEP